MKLLIAAGGTGGHILPAIALGDAIAREYPHVQFEFLCGEREIERQLYAANGIDPIVFPARQLGSGIGSRVQAAGAALSNTLKAIGLIRKREFDTVIGMGGYVTGPAVLGGILTRRFTAIHESNSIPGKTNKLLAPWVTVSAVNFGVTAGMLRSRRVIRTGMPIRPAALEGTREEALKEFGLDRARRTLLILGGSQGARYLYETLMASVALLDTPMLADTQILWSTGAGNFTDLKSRLAAVSPRHLSVHLLPFIEKMGLAYAVADVALARAGSSTIAELLANGIYSLYVPLPAAIYDHQTHNAKQVAASGAGELIAEKKLTPERAAECVSMLMGHAKAGRRISTPPELDSRDAAKALADALCSRPAGGPSS